MGLGKTEWEDILIEKGIIAAPKDVAAELHPEITYDISNNSDDDDLLDDDDFISEYQ